MSAALRVVSDPAMPRGPRLELWEFPIACAPCGDLHQLLFGMNPEFTKAIARARKQLVRFPSDSVWFDKVSLAMERPMANGFGDGGGVFNVLNRVARAVDFLTGSKRMQSCASLSS